MFTDTDTLIEQTIDHLNTLCGVFVEELDDQRAAYNPVARRCEETIATIERLVPQLRAVQEAQGLQQLVARPPYCAHCD